MVSCVHLYEYIWLVGNFIFTIKFKNLIVNEKQLETFCAKQLEIILCHDPCPKTFVTVAVNIFGL